MSSLGDKLKYLHDTKIAIRNAMLAQGMDVPLGTPFSAYAAIFANYQCSI